MKICIAQVAFTLLSIAEVAESQVRGSGAKFMNRELSELKSNEDRISRELIQKDCLRIGQQGRGPTCSPTLVPSVSPSLSPKFGEIVSDAPSYVPTSTLSDAPSDAPTKAISGSPTVSAAPSPAPTTSSKPSTSAPPTSAPSISSAPSPSPTAAPTKVASATPTGTPTISSSPTSAPTISTQPSAENQLRFIADDNEVDLPEHSLGKCEADCDSDADCEYGLICYQRDMGDYDVPGCVGNATVVNDGNDDFCIEPPTANTLVIMGDDDSPESAYPFGECQGECDGDDDCGLGLVCFERDDETPVPGCVGDGVWGFDYCYRPPAIVEYVGDYEMGYYELGNCQSDCDYDSDCGFGLVCFRRGLGDPGGIPGCDGDAMTFGTGGEDYCISPPTENTLVIVYDFEDDIGTYPVGRCQGDCDTDADCAGFLRCVDRTAAAVLPGCIGLGEEEYAYCI